MLLAGYDVVKVVERQHLEVEEDESGVKSMTMTSNPSLYVPGMGDVSIGDVCFQVSPTEDGSSCKVPSLMPEAPCLAGLPCAIGSLTEIIARTGRRFQLSWQ